MTDGFYTKFVRIVEPADAVPELAINGGRWRVHSVNCDVAQNRFLLIVALLEMEQAKADQVMDAALDCRCAGMVEVIEW